MCHSTVQFAWRDTMGPFRTGVCLHGHTLHSEECLDFLPRYLRRIPGVGCVLRGYERGGNPVRFARAYWTPPLSATSAFGLERLQIAGMGLRPFVSLTDHDNIEAGMALQIAVDSREAPISVEWTVPYQRSILHLGVHNLPPESARNWMAVMAAYTAAPSERILPDLLCELASLPGVLIVLNHPFWLEEGVMEPDHDRALDRILGECLEWVHAFELNGTRRWSENARVMELAKGYSRPVISGGDRHACEPAACINLTNASSFAEFVSEVRDGRSVVCFLPQYREPMTARVLEAAWDILKPYPENPGRERWTDRFFYRGADDVARPLSVIWRDRVPPAVAVLTAFVQMTATTRLRQAFRLLQAERGEALR